MVTYALQYLLDDAAHIARLKVGFNESKASITVSHGDAEFERCVDVLGENFHPVAIDGKYSLGLSASEWLDLNAAQREAKAAAAAAAAETARREGENVALAKPEFWLDYGGRIVTSRYCGFDALSESAKASVQQCVDSRLARQAAQQQRTQRREEESEAKKQAATQERLGWIEVHGSTRLKRLVAEKIECERVYRTERLALERPGWQFYADVPGVTKAPRNCPEEAFLLLDEARKVVPDAKLQWYVENDTTDEYGEETAPGRKCYVAEAEFLGLAIVFFGN